MRITFLVLIAVLFGGTRSAMGQSTQFDPASYKSAYEQPTQIMVFGTTHLDRLSDDWDKTLLEPLLEVLESFAPDAIAIEALSGEDAFQLAAFKESYPSESQNYTRPIVRIAKLAQDELQIDAGDAQAQARQLLNLEDADLTVEKRAQLVGLLAAAGNPYSALLQWRLLTSHADGAIDDLPPQLIEALEAIGNGNDESVSIGVSLAAHLGHQQVFPIDDHSNDDAAHAAVTPAMTEIFEEPWFQARPDNPKLTDSTDFLNSPEEVESTFHLLNRYDLGETEAGQLHYVLENLGQSPNALAGRRMITAFQEIRNLRQVSNIMEVSSFYPGKKILVIVGASHKHWFDAYLSMMLDVEIIQFNDWKI